MEKLILPIRTFLFFLLQVVSLLIHAARIDINKIDLAEGAVFIPSKLVSSGMSEIGGINLNDLIKKFRDPNFVTFHLLSGSEMHSSSLGAGPGVSQMRYGGHCFDKVEAKNTEIGRKLNVQGGLVIIDPRNIIRLAAENSDRLYPMLLHEGLCALYGPASDFNYQISSTLSYLSLNLGKTKVSNQMWKTISLWPSFHSNSLDQRSSMSTTLAMGGVTGGGGGGDTDGLFLKTLLYVFFDIMVESCIKESYKDSPSCKYLIINHEEIFRQLLPVSIEIDNNENTNCQQTQGINHMPFKSMQPIDDSMGSQTTLIRVGQCQLIELLNMYDAHAASIQVFKMIWIILLERPEFPKTNDFNLDDLVIFKF